MDSYIGKPLPRLEDQRFLTGKGCYTADIDLPGQAYAVVLRSSHAHAKIEDIDAEIALQAPGVLAAYTCAHLRAAGIRPIPSLTRTPPYRVLNADGSEMPDGSQYPLATDRVRYVGEPVALIVAETASEARDAAERIQVRYRPLPAVIEIEAALANDATSIWPELSSNRSCRWQAGDEAAVAAGLRGAARVVELEVEYPRQIVAFMEPRAAIAAYDPTSGRFTLQVGVQAAHQLRATLAQVLDVGEDAIRVIVPDVGGGFGARNVLYPEFVLALFAARALGRPVKWVAERSESFLSDTQARSQRLRGSLGLDSEGRFLALQFAATWRHGAYLASRSVFVLATWMAPMICGPYRIPAQHFTLEGVFTNTAPIASYRGVARAEITYLLERLVDVAARQSGIDRIELRRRNLIAPVGNALAVADRRRLSADPVRAQSRPRPRGDRVAGLRRPARGGEGARPPARDRRVGLHRERRWRVVRVCEGPHRRRGRRCRPRRHPGLRHGPRDRLRPGGGGRLGRASVDGAGERRRHRFGRDRFRHLRLAVGAARRWRRPCRARAPRPKRVGCSRRS